jgi:hypothetical protein
VTARGDERVVTGVGIRQQHVGVGRNLRRRLAVRGEEHPYLARLRSALRRHWTHVHAAIDVVGDEHAVRRFLQAFEELLPLLRNGFLADARARIRNGFGHGQSPVIVNAASSAVVASLAAGERTKAT